MEATFENCDGALWHVDVIQDKDEIRHEVDSTIYKYVDRNLTPDDLGFKYHILTYKGDDTDSAEVMCAYIGDVSHFIANYAKAGYNGMMVKHKAIPTRDIKTMFAKILSNWEFPKRKINALIKQV